MEFFTELETLITNLLTNNQCSCHFINPKKTRIILWKKIESDREIYYLRIGLQKFISYSCLDREGAAYWKFEPYHSKEEEKKLEINSAIAKFKERQKKTEELSHGSNTNSN